MNMKVTWNNKTANLSDDPKGHLNPKPTSEYEAELREKKRTKNTALLMSLHTFRVAGLFIFVIYGLS